MTERKTVIDPKDISIISIKVISGNIASDEDIDTNIVTSFNTAFEVQTGLNLDQGAIRILIKIILVGIDSNDKQVDISGKYTIEFIFRIVKLESYVISRDEEKQELTMDDVLASTLMAIVYSTSRGIVLTRTQGTVLDGVVLPVIDPLQLLMAQAPKEQV